jgi:NAD dependent epimerase/dehydratase family enzyme
VLKSRRVIPGRLVEGGFQFQFPEWAAAAQNLVGRWGAPDRLKFTGV